MKRFMLIFSVIFFSNNLMAVNSKTPFDQLDNVILQKILSKLDSTSFTSFANSSKSMNVMAEDNIKYQLASNQLAPNQIVELGFDHPNILQEMTKINLETLPVLGTKSEKAAAILVWDLVWTQVRSQAWAQVRPHVEDQVWGQIRDQVEAQVGGEVGGEVGDQVGDQVGLQVWGQIRDQAWNQVWDQVRVQAWNQVRHQVWEHVWNKIKGILPLCPNMGSSEKDRNKFINALIPISNKTISVYHYFFVKRLLEQSEDGKGTILETLVDQIKNGLEENDIDLSPVYNAATPGGWEEMNQHTINFLYPIQKYSEPLNEGAVL